MSLRAIFLILTSVAALLVDLSSAFGGLGSFSRAPRLSSRQTTQLHGFGNAFKKAFESDDSLGKAQDAGLTRGPTQNEKVTINGKPVKAIVGQKVPVVANSARVKIKYDCRNGDCGTCMIKMNGRKVKACQQVIPAGACSIETL